MAALRDNDSNNEDHHSGSTSSSSSANLLSLESFSLEKTDEQRANNAKRAEMKAIANRVIRSSKIINAYQGTVPAATSNYGIEYEEYTTLTSIPPMKDKIFISYGHQRKNSEYVYAKSKDFPIHSIVILPNKLYKNMSELIDIGDNGITFTMGDNMNYNKDYKVKMLKPVLMHGVYTIKLKKIPNNYKDGTPDLNTRIRGNARRGFSVMNVNHQQPRSRSRSRSPSRMHVDTRRIRNGGGTKRSKRSKRATRRR